MIAAADSVAQGGGLRPSYSATRARLGLVALLFALAALAWWITADRMDGMDAGPGTALGTLGWFLGVWVVMMAAMMFPSVAPTVALYAQMTKRREPFGPLAFAAGYLLTWAAAGLLAYGVFVLGRELLGDDLAWDSGGRWLAGGIVAVRGRLRAHAAQGRLPRRGAAARSASCSATGATGWAARSRWGRSTAPGAWAAAGR